MSNNAAIDMEAIKETFFIECEEHISNMEKSILEMEENPNNAESLNSIFRAAHSLKGNSGCLGFNEINSFTHTLETVLDRLRNGEMEASGAVISLLLESADCVKALVGAAKEGKEGCEGVDDTLKRLKGLLDGGAGGAAPEKADGESKACVSENACERLLRIIFSPGPDTLRRGIDPMNYILRELSERGEVIKTDVNAGGLPPFHDMDPERCYLSWEILLLTREEASEVEGVFEFIKDDGIIKIEVLSSGARAPEGRDRHLGKSQGHASADISSHERAAPESTGRKLIGEILVEEKIITPVQLKEALKKQSAQHKEESSTIRVDTEKVDKLINLVGELVITQSMITELSAKPSVEKLGVMQNVAVQLERSTREIQERVMSIRMLPIGSVFSRFTRLVRDIAQARGKKASLSISGEETELDKSVIEKISDPLTHLIRNSVDHGIETPEERAEKGKPDAGCVRLNAFHGGGYVIVTVEDDGKGLDREKIVRKAVERGIVEGHNAENLTDAQAYEMIFLPGFSTAEKVTDVSGRGVGMDVVKRNIEELGGSVSVESKKGASTKVTLRIPLTLAIIDGLTVQVGDETFILPINSILESRRPKKADVKMVKGECETVCIRGSYIPVIKLHEVFDLRPRQTDPWNSLLVVVTANSGRYALMVDDLTGEQQAVIKSMGERFRNLPGVAGATILGDGKVALIIDIEGVVKKYARA